MRSRAGRHGGEVSRLEVLDDLRAHLDGVRYLLDGKGPSRGGSSAASRRIDWPSQPSISIVFGHLGLDLLKRGKPLFVQGTSRGFEAVRRTDDALLFKTYP